MLLNSFARTLELKENWGGITTQTILEFDEPIKNMMIKLQKIETVAATEIPEILKSFSDCDVAFINSSLLFDLIKIFEYGDFNTALVRACTVSLESIKFLYVRKDVFDKDFYTAVNNAMLYGRTDIVEFLWQIERPVLQKIDLISMARKVGFGMLTFMIEKLKIVDDGMGLLNFCRNSVNSTTEYILAHNSYQPYIYWLMIYKCIIEDNLYVINLIIDKVDPNSKIAAILLTKAIEKKRSAMVPRFLFRYKFTFNGGVEFTEKSLLAQKEKFLTLIPDAAEIMKHMDAPYKYAESIGYEQFPIILKTYINNTVIKYKSIVMLKMLIQQGFSKDFLFTLCDWSQTSPEFVQIFMGIVFDTLDKINFFFTNCINLGNHHMIKYLLQNNKILAVDIQKNDDFFLAVFKSQSPGRLETLKLLIEHCGGIEKLEISPQRLIRFCEENLNFESDQLKEYLQTLQKNRYAKKRQITLESDNDEPTALDMLANAAIAEEPPIEVKSTEQMRVEKRTMEEERQKLQQKKAETEAKIRAKFAEEADAEKAEKKVENPFKILREAILEKHAEEKRKAEEQKKARSPIEIKTMIRVETEKPNMIQELLAKTPTLIASFPLPVIDFVPKNTETERALVEIQRKYACIYCDRPLEKSGYYTGRPRTVCETCKNTRRAEARKKRKTIDESESD